MLCTLFLLQQLGCAGGMDFGNSDGSDSRGNQDAGCAEVLVPPEAMTVVLRTTGAVYTPDGVCNYRSLTDPWVLRLQSTTLNIAGKHWLTSCGQASKGPQESGVRTLSVAGTLWLTQMVSRSCYGDGVVVSGCAPAVTVYTTCDL
jgi:hypothetical protein